MAKSKKPEPQQEQPKVLISLSVFPRELLEQACREIQANKARQKITG
ncbi:hypothetical protein ACFSR7_12430 [Cohnella sp. GCM10020058]